jgi:hypothetical protein
MAPQFDRALRDLLRAAGCVAHGVVPQKAVIPRHRVSPPASPMTGSSGIISTPRLLDSIINVSGILDHPLSRMMTTVRLESKISNSHIPYRHAFAFPRREAPEFCQQHPALNTEGAGNAGRPERPQPRVECSKHAR